MHEKYFYVLSTSPQQEGDSRLGRALWGLSGSWWVGPGFESYQCTMWPGSRCGGPRWERAASLAFWQVAFSWKSNWKSWKTMWLQLWFAQPLF